jgi:hypothetical protein
MLWGGGDDEGEFVEGCGGDGVGLGGSYTLGLVYRSLDLGYNGSVVLSLGYRLVVGIG